MKATIAKQFAKEEAALVIVILLTKIFHSALSVNQEEQMKLTKCVGYVQGKDFD